MRVMTFNLRTDFILDINNRWKNRAHIIYEIFDKYDCDIIGLQEVNNLMFKDVSMELSNYNIVGEPRSKKIFVERNDILVSKKHKILESNTFWLSNYPDKIGTSVWYSLYPRICTTAIVHLEDGDVVRVYNTHLDCFLTAAREHGLKKISEYIEKQHKIDGLPIILMGDFNATPNSKLIKNFSAKENGERQFVAVQESKREIYEMTTMGRFKGRKKGRHIDYIFVSEEFTILDAKIINYSKSGKYPSDHYPILADLNIR
ncbi:MAG: endonuclease/exonuclease/phosphatase family protein [Clostridium sp.]|uniref:endonuclease/exonuclease/phosphatase family protein n=1 Tax=Clostridium sp. TaxID=1506 RepID=UPI00303F1DBB